MTDLSMFLPITKVDAAKRLVYAIATAEVEDRAHEICDYASTKPNYEKWSGDIAKTTNGKSYGNLRAMHGNIAAGKVTQIAFNDDAKQIEICAKVVDDAEWNKVQEGVYTGVSQGGSYERRWTDEGGLTRYTASPSEISLVDLPCLPEATFQMIKADGTAETCHFQENAGKGTVLEPPNRTQGLKQVWVPDDFEGGHIKKVDALAALADQQARAAASEVVNPVLKALDGIEEKLGIEKREFSDKEREKAAESGAALNDGSFPIKTKEDLENAVHALGRAKDKDKAKAHIIARAKALDATDMLPADWEGSTKKPDKASAIAELAKMGGDCRDAAQAIMIINTLYDLLSVEDGADEPDEQAAAITSAISSLKSFVISEIQEDGDGNGGDGGRGMDAPSVMAYAARSYFRKVKAQADDIDNSEDQASALTDLAHAAVGELAKIGARNSAADMVKIQSIHDATVDMGATCSGGDDDMAGKLAKLDAEKSALDGTLKQVLERLKRIEETPLPLPVLGAARAVSKGHEFGAHAGEDTARAELARLTQTKEGRDYLFKLAAEASFANPQKMGAVL